MSKFNTMTEKDKQIIKDFPDYIEEHKYDDCECDHTCWHKDTNPKSNLVCDTCFYAIEYTEDELHREMMEMADPYNEHGHPSSDMLDDGQTFYNHHEANDSWQK